MARSRNTRRRTPPRRPNPASTSPAPTDEAPEATPSEEVTASTEPVAVEPPDEAADAERQEVAGPVEASEPPAANRSTARRGRGHRARPKLTTPAPTVAALEAATSPTSESAAPADPSPASPTTESPAPVDPSPAVEEPEPADDEPEPVVVAAVGERPQKGQSRQRGVRAALATLPVPEPGPSFWADIERAMAEQPPLSITARPAIRPITEPPPLSQPSLADHLGSTAVLITGDEPAGFDDIDPPDGDSRGGPRPSAPAPASTPPKGPDTPLRGRFGDANGSNTRTAVILLAVAVLAVLAAGNFLGNRRDDPSGAEETTNTTAAPSTTATTARPTTTVPSVPGLAADARLTPNGLGPLLIGASLRDLTAAGVKANVDQATFVTSGGACYDAKVPGAPDLTLRFRSPDDDTGVTDPQDGQLASIGITAAPGSPRVTEPGVRLGATEDDVRNAHRGNVEVTGHPVNPGGHLMISYAQDGKAVAYGTDGRTVTEIAVGYAGTISQRQGCY